MDDFFFSFPVYLAVHGAGSVPGSLHVVDVDFDEPCGIPVDGQIALALFTDEDLIYRYMAESGQLTDCEVMIVLDTQGLLKLLRGAVAFDHVSVDANAKTGRCFGMEKTTLTKMLLEATS
jgi:hypothetical protein